MKLDNESAKVVTDMLIDKARHNGMREVTTQSQYKKVAFFLLGISILMLLAFFGGCS